MMPLRAVVEIEHRREGQVDPASTQLGSERQADLTCRRNRRLRVVVPPVAEPAHRRHACKCIAATLHAPAFVVDGDQQRWRAQAMNRRAEGCELLRIDIVAGEQDRAADQRMAQAFALFRGQFGTGDIDHQRAVIH